MAAYHFSVKTKKKLEFSTSKKKYDEAVNVQGGTESLFDQSSKKTWDIL